MKKTKIDWCDCTLNPVVGCKNNCEYCYARKINDRFNFIPNWCEPQFFPERLEQLKSKQPKTIFMDSMSDCGFWNIKWIREIAQHIKKNPQHKYIFLTKCPELFIEKCRSIVETANKNNVFIGTTITKQSEILRMTYLPAPFVCETFVSFEPLLEEINIPELNECRMIKQIIIGAETGKRKHKIVPKKEWVDKIVQFADENDIQVFMKSSLKDIMGKDFRQDKLIWEIENEKD